MLIHTISLKKVKARPFGKPKKYIEQKLVIRFKKTISIDQEARIIEFLETL